MRILTTVFQILSGFFGAGETPEFSGMCILGLIADPDLMKKTGRILPTTKLAKDYDLHDLDGGKSRIYQANLFLSPERW